MVSCRPLGASLEEGHWIDPRAVVLVSAGHLCYGDRLRELGLFSLKERSSGETLLWHLAKPTGAL